MSLQSLEQILWACRRGMLELDLVLAPFAEVHWHDLSDEDKTTFAHLLTYYDQDLYQWVIGNQQPPDPAVAKMMERIRNHAQRTV